MCLFLFIVSLRNARPGSFQKSSRMKFTEHFRSSVGCANEPFAHRLPCGKRVRWLGWSRLTDLAQLQNLNYAEKCQQLNFLRFSAVAANVRLQSRLFARWNQSLRRSPN